MPCEGDAGGDLGVLVRWFFFLGALRGEFMCTGLLVVLISLCVRVRCLIPISLYSRIRASLLVYCILLHFFLRLTESRGISMSSHFFAKVTGLKECMEA